MTTQKNTNHTQIDEFKNDSVQIRKFRSQAGEIFYQYHEYFNDVSEWKELTAENIAFFLSILGQSVAGVRVRAFFAGGK